jgi:hypothetical protein
LASYERRGLLNCSESPTFLPVQPSGDWGGIIGETQDYRQSPGKSGDKVN